MRPHALLAALSLCSLSLTGCRAEQRQSLAPAPEKTAQQLPAAQALPPNSFTNEQGKLVCPVMGDEIASVDEARGHEEYQGKHYYFCCTSCVKAFKKDPEKYADGRFLKEKGKGCGEGSMNEGSPTGLCQ